MKSLFDQMTEGLRSGKPVRAYMYEDTIFALDDWIEFLISSGNFSREIIHKQLDELIVDGSGATFEYIDAAFTKHMSIEHSADSECPVASLQVEWRERHYHIVEANIQTNIDVTNTDVTNTDVVKTELSAEEINQMYSKAFEGNNDASGTQGTGAEAAERTKTEADSPTKKAARKVGKRKRSRKT